nr:hypothetical protein [uncultured Romboutsia sp.]
MINNYNNAKNVYILIAKTFVHEDKEDKSKTTQNKSKKDEYAKNII